MYIYIHAQIYIQLELWHLEAGPTQGEGTQSDGLCYISISVCIHTFSYI